MYLESRIAVDISIPRMCEVLNVSRENIGDNELYGRKRNLGCLAQCRFAEFWDFSR